jgi:tripartite-type tricarboxylate transporter receptor subunit TctC
MDRRHLLQGSLSFTLSAAGVGALGSAQAQDAWPVKQITIIVPFPPGGQADLAARPIAEALKTVLGQTVIVENRSGAGGATGNAAAARAAPDGYTLLMSLSSLAVLPEAQKMFGRTPGYEVDQFVPIARVLGDPTVFCCHVSMPWKSIADLVDDAKRRPGVITFASSGYYGAGHIPTEMFMRAADIKLVHVPYRGGGPALADVLAGQVNCMSSGPGPILQHRDRSVRVLACHGAKRIAAFPDVPTFMELGFKEVEFYLWAGLFAPKDVPAPIVAKLRDAMRKAMVDPAVVRVFENVGSPPAYLDGPDFAKFMETDNARLISAVRKIGMIEGKLE